MIKYKTTPYLTAHPELTGLLTREQFDKRSVIDGEYVEFTIFDEGRLVWRSGERDLSLSEGLQADFFYRDREHPRTYMNYLRVFRGQTFRVVVRVRTPRPTPNSRGVARLTLSPNAQGPSPLRAARGRASRLLRRSRGARSGFPASSSPRPNVSITESAVVVVEGSDRTDVVPTSRFRYSRFWTGVRTPGFGRLKKSQLPVNPHTVAILDVEADVLVEMEDWRGTSPTETYFFVQHGPFTYHYLPPASPSHLETARNTTISRLISQTENGIQANLAQDLAQISQTTSLIGGNAIKIAQSMRQLKRGNFPGAISILFAGRPPRFPRSRPPSVLYNLASNWLQLQYGWKPLLQDIEGSLKALSQLALSSQGFIQRVRASASASQTTESSFDPWSPNSRPTRGVEIINTETRTKMVLSYTIDSPLQAFLSQTGFTNPINLGWEILPFSFVVDWFTGIGPYLEALSAWDGLRFIDGSETNFTRQIAVKAIDGGTQIIGAAPGAVRIDHGTYRRTGVLLSRVRLTSFPRQNYVPRFANGLASLTHATNAIALVKTVFGR